LDKFEYKKRDNLRENIQTLENLSGSIKTSIDQLEELVESISEDRKKLISTIQNTFTKIRNIINEREDELILEVETLFTDKFISDDYFRKIKNLPSRIKHALSQVESIEEKWNDNKLSALHEYLDIENSIADIESLGKNIEKCRKNNNFKLKFFPQNTDNCQLFDDLKHFGEVLEGSFKFKPCPENIEPKRQYKLNDVKKNIVVKTGQNGHSAILCDYILEQKKLYRWGIKIIKTQIADILVGIAPYDLDLNAEQIFSKGYFFYLYNSTFYSGEPYNYYGKTSNLDKTKDEITIEMDAMTNTLKFIIDGKDCSYKDIPSDKKYVPAVVLFNPGDSVEIKELY
jgi:hypothetical protein